MALPSIKLQIANIITSAPENGILEYKYSPFKNLKTTGSQELDTITDLTDLTLSLDNAEINIDKPINLDIEESYDGSVNLIVNDEVNPLKMVNSRFYLTSSTTYNIADRKGNLDTNIYTAEDFKIEAGLIKTVRSIISVDFLGIASGGRMSVGNYTFYFKLSDSDGNESDFVTESGKVVCYIGNVNQPSSIRGGQQDEDSGKIVKFRLNNLDLAYDYIHIYYTRTTGNEDNEVVKTYKINDKFKINKLNTEISITGYETHEEVSNYDINIQLTNFDSVKSNANCQNITFAGNITNDYELFDTLEKYSLLVVPELSYEENIGNLNHKYVETFPDTGYEYFNANNIYYKLGYWDNEIYRFGIVYILNDYTLSPVFNIRGTKELSDNSFHSFDIDDVINSKEDYIIDGTDDDNSKGVVKIKSAGNMFNDVNATTPIGIKFKFTGRVVEGSTLNKGLKDLVKGFFIVRQKRIPTILAQGVGIGTSTLAYTPLIKASSSTINNKWIAESFLQHNGGAPRLGHELFTVNKVTQNALLCPEAAIRRRIFNNYFNSSNYTLTTGLYSPSRNVFTDNEGSGIHFNLGNLSKKNSDEKYLSSSLTLIEPGVELIKNDTYKFSSKAGDAIVSYKHSDPVLGNYEDPETPDADFSFTSSKLRGEFNTYIGCNTLLQPCQYYNIYQKDYDFKNRWKDYFKIRYNDSSPYMPISNRYSWDDAYHTNEYITDGCYRGDCYISTFTHRMNWNFIDNDLPTNKRIVDPFTWYKNFRIVKRNSVVVKQELTNGSESGVDVSTSLVYKKLLPLFTYKKYSEPAFNGDTYDDTDGARPVANGLIEPDGKKYKKYSEINGVFGTEKMNRPDVNAVQLGHWVTFKICSNINLNLRDLDFTRPEEEALHKQKRGFYPLQALDKSNPLPESDVINQGISKSLGDKYYFEVPNVPFIKTNFSTRIYYSNALQRTAFTNGNRIFESKNYVDYSMEYGALVKLVEWYGTLVAIMEHGVLLIPVNERAMMTNASGENVYINTANVLPANPKVLSNTFGSLWADSVIKTPKFIYGIDTVGKKIWRTNGQQFEIISDLKIQKFLNDNISLKEADTVNKVGISYVKSHYNAFKQDVMFVFKYGETKWNLCWNEVLGRWVTQYTWFPEFSENINNIFYTFADQSIHSEAKNYLYKHGFAGTEETSGTISPTFWYEKQHPFEYEFVVADVPGVQKIFNNLKIVSNLAEPDSIFYEIVGEGFEWNKLKDKFYKFKTQIQFSELLRSDPDIKKIPYIMAKSFNVLDSDSFFNQPDESVRDISIREHNKTKEKLINIYQKAMDIKIHSRLKGNMQYLEDSWDIQIQPITFKYAYLTSQGQLGIVNDSTESRIRDKYIKIRVKYSGKQYAIINALKTLYTISYA